MISVELVIQYKPLSSDRYEESFAHQLVIHFMQQSGPVEVLREVFTSLIKRFLVRAQA